MRSLSAITWAFLLASFFSRAQLVLNSGIKVYLNGGTSAKPVTLVLNNSPATPITRLGTTTAQGIVLDDEYNRVQYNLDQGTTGITVPYISNTTGSWVPFPFRMYNVTAGTHAAGKTASIRFSSTKATTLASGWDNYNYRPSQVLNVCGNSGGCINNSNANDNSANVIDRFWIIEPVNYNSAATRPACTFDFTYIMEEADLNGGNTASLYNSLEAQRFDTVNTGSSIWGWNGFPSSTAEMGTNTPGAMNATSVGTCTGVVVSAANFFPDWTLASTLIVLPIDLLSFTADCESYNTTLRWSTAREENAASYIIEKSKDGIHFAFLKEISAVGNSIVKTNYAYVDVQRNEDIAYYRLTQIDKNGAKKTFEKLAVSTCSDEGDHAEVYSYQNDVYLNFYSRTEQCVTLRGYDVTGRLVYRDGFEIATGFSQLKVKPMLAEGIYLFELDNGKMSLTKKIFISN
jgi:hypothetical protein